MGTDLLWPQECLARQAPSYLPRRTMSPIPNPSADHKLLRKAQTPEARWRREGSLAKPLQRKQLLIGRITILKRGEQIEGAATRKEEGGAGDASLSWDTIVLGTGSLGPAMAPMKNRVVPLRHDPAIEVDGYAGSAFSMSPSPRSLPLPSFSRGKSCVAAFDRLATVGLRRLLRLE